MNLALLVQGPVEAVHKAALALGTANQLTNILRDVGEDAVERNRIYGRAGPVWHFRVRGEAILSLCLWPSSPDGCDPSWALCPGVVDPRGGSKASVCTL